MGLFELCLSPQVAAGRHQGKELASSVTRLPEVGIRWCARSKQLLDGAYIYIFRILALKERLDRLVLSQLTGTLFTVRRPFFFESWN